MSIAQATELVEELADEVRRENDRRYAFYRMLSATDRVLGQLEELNRDGAKTISVEAWERMRGTLSELPEVALAALADPPGVQALLDGIFEAQEVLLRWHDPERLSDEEAEELPVGLDDQILARLEDHPDGLPPNELAYSFPGPLQRTVRRRVVELAEAGRVRHEVVKTAGSGPPKRRFFAVGEGEGG
jgi:hypothetical protein